MAQSSGQPCQRRAGRPAPGRPTAVFRPARRPFWVWSAPPWPDAISTSFVNAKAERRQYQCTASDVGKVHGCFRNGMTCSGPAATGAWSATAWWQPTRRATSGAIGTCAETPAGSVLAVIFGTRPVVPNLRESRPTHRIDGFPLRYIPRSGVCFNIVTNASRCTPTGRATNIADTLVRRGPGHERRTKPDQALASIVSKGKRRDRRPPV